MQNKFKFSLPVTVLLVGVVTVAIVLGVIFVPGYNKEKTVVGGGNLTAYAINEAEYPKTLDYPDIKSQNFYEEEQAWERSRQELLKDYNAKTMNIDAFFKNTLQTFLSDSKGENKVYSPLNMYFALGMLAEITDGNSRNEILKTLSVKDIEELRKTSNALFKANYYNDKRVSSILANSLWLNDKVKFNKDTLKNISDVYYASSYKGEMGSKEFDGAIASWINKNTENLLKNETSNIETTKYTIISLISTIYYKASWTDKFNEIATKKQTFYADGGEYEYDFMNMSRQGTVYYGKGFSSARLSLDGSGYMYFILPDKNSSVEEIIKGDDAVKLITSGDSWQNKTQATVNYAVPKFDVSASLDLEDGLKELGIKDVFSRFKSDFSPLTDEKNLAVSSAQHSARVMIDEEGCTGAAYTMFAVEGMSAPPPTIIDFTLDRPFIFAVTSSTGEPLFAGVVNKP